MVREGECERKGERERAMSSEYWRESERGRR